MEDNIIGIQDAKETAMKVYVCFEDHWKRAGEPDRAFANEADAIAYAKAHRHYYYRELELIFPTTDTTEVE